MRFHPDNNVPDYNLETDNVPYRGTVPHLPDKQDTATWPAREKTKTDPTKDFQEQDLPALGKTIDRPTFTEPIPVWIAHPVPSIDEFKYSEFYSSSVSTDTAQRILGRDKTRLRARIRNVSDAGDNNIYLGQNPAIQGTPIGNVFVLTPGGEDLILESQNEIYAIGESSGICTISVSVDRVERT